MAGHQPKVAPWMSFPGSTIKLRRFSWHEHMTYDRCIDAYITVLCILYCTLSLLLLLYTIIITIITIIITIFIITTIIILIFIIVFLSFLNVYIYIYVIGSTPRFNCLMFALTSPQAVSPVTLSVSPADGGPEVRAWNSA